MSAEDRNMEKNGRRFLEEFSMSSDSSSDFETSSNSNSESHSLRIPDSVDQED